jgi:hypothetical protein
VRDGLADHAQECYGVSVGKSMKAAGMTESEPGSWLNVAIRLIDRAVNVACLQRLSCNCVRSLRLQGAKSRLR